MDNQATQQERTKVCNKCSQEKPLSSFYKRKDSPCGITSDCKCCINEKNKKWTQKNKEYHYSLNKEWINNNREKAREYWRESNKRHITRVMASNRKYEALKKNAVPLWFEEEPIKYLYKKAQEYSFHVDHIVPLRSDHVCGLHCFDNLQLLDRELNLKKSNRYWPDMWEYH